jgi:hypothetical protein
VLANVVLSHIPVRHGNYRPKAVFLALMARGSVLAAWSNALA